MISPLFRMSGDEARGLLFGLLESDKIQLRKYPDMPSMREMIRDKRVVYDAYDPQEHWKTYKELVEEVRGNGTAYGDCEELAVAVAAEDQVRHGVGSLPYAYSPREGLFHVVTAVPSRAVSRQPSAVSPSAFSRQGPASSSGTTVVSGAGGRLEGKIPFGFDDWPVAMGATSIPGYLLQDPSRAAGMGATFGYLPGAEAGMSRYGAYGQEERRGLGRVFRPLGAPMRELGAGVRKGLGLEAGWERRLGEELPGRLGVVSPVQPSREAAVSAIQKGLEAEARGEAPSPAEPEEEDMDFDEDLGDEEFGYGGGYWGQFGGLGDTVASEMFGRTVVDPCSQIEEVEAQIEALIQRGVVTVAQKKEIASLMAERDRLIVQCASSRRSLFKTPSSFLSWFGQDDEEDLGDLDEGGGGGGGFRLPTLPTWVLPATLGAAVGAGAVGLGAYLAGRKRKKGTNKYAPEAGTGAGTEGMSGLGDAVAAEMFGQDDYDDETVTLPGTISMDPFREWELQETSWSPAGGEWEYDPKLKPWVLPTAIGTGAGLAGLGLGLALGGRKRKKKDKYAPEPGAGEVATPEAVSGIGDAVAAEMFGAAEDEEWAPSARVERQRSRAAELERRATAREEAEALREGRRIQRREIEPAFRKIERDVPAAQRAIEEAFPAEEEGYLFESPKAFRLWSAAGRKAERTFEEEPEFLSWLEEEGYGEDIAARDTTQEDIVRANLLETKRAWDAYMRVQGLGDDRATGRALHAYNQARTAYEASLRDLRSGRTSFAGLSSLRRSDLFGRDFELGGDDDEDFFLEGD